VAQTKTIYQIVLTEVISCTVLFIKPLSWFLGLGLI
jgi:hypothetical protein